MMARNSSPNPTEESNSVFYETEDRNNIKELIRPRSPASTDDGQPPPKPTCLSQLDGGNDHRDDPEKGTPKGKQSAKSSLFRVASLTSSPTKK